MFIRLLMRVTIYRQKNIRLFDIKVNKRRNNIEKEKIIQGLQQIVTGLSTQAEGHAIMAKVFADKGFNGLSEKYEEHATEERDYASQMVERILDLGGEVKLENREGAPIVSDPLEWIKYDLEVSKQGLSFLHELVEYSRPDYKTYDILQAYYIDEEEDLLWSELQIELIEKIGYENWLVKYL